MTRPEPKRPHLTPGDRARLRNMSIKALVNGEAGHNRAYCKGVTDVLDWLASNEPMTEMLREVTR